MFEVVAASDIVRNSLLTLWGGVAFSCRVL